MLRFFLLTIVIVPVLLGIVAARSRRLRVGVVRLLLLVFAYDLLFILILFYVRRR